MATVKSPPDITMAPVKISDSPIPDITMENPKPLSNTPPDISMVPAPKSPQVGRSMDVETSPHPRTIANSELRVLEDCLHRWRTEVENDVRGMKPVFKPLFDY